MRLTSKLRIGKLPNMSSAKTLLKNGSIASGLEKSSKQRALRSLMTRDGSNQSVTERMDLSGDLSEADSVTSLSIQQLVDDFDDNLISNLEKPEEHNSSSKQIDGPSGSIDSSQSFNCSGNDRRVQFASSKNFQHTAGNGRREQFASSNMNPTSASTMRSFRSPGSGRREQFASTNNFQNSASMRNMRRFDRSESFNAGNQFQDPHFPSPREQFASTKSVQFSASMRSTRTFDHSAPSFLGRNGTQDLHTRCPTLQRVNNNAQNRGSAHKRTLPNRSSCRGFARVDHTGRVEPIVQNAPNRNFQRYSSNRNIGNSIPQSTYDKFSSSVPVFSQESTADLYPEMYLMKRNSNDLEVGAEMARDLASSGRQKRRSVTFEQGLQLPTENSAESVSPGRRKRRSAAPAGGEQRDQLPVENSEELSECRAWVFYEETPSWLKASQPESEQ